MRISDWSSDVCSSDLKYAEGYPGKRYYNGCEFVDVAETLAIERAKKLFGCGFANVQPHSGAQANQAVFMACLKPGDTFMGLEIGRASCRERVCQGVETWVGAVY